VLVVTRPEIEWYNARPVPLERVAGNQAAAWKMGGQCGEVPWVMLVSGNVGSIETLKQLPCDVVVVDDGMLFFKQLENFEGLRKVLDHQDVFHLITCFVNRRRIIYFQVMVNWQVKVGQTLLDHFMGPVPLCTYIDKYLNQTRPCRHCFGLSQRFVTVFHISRSQFLHENALIAL